MDICPKTSDGIHRVSFSGRCRFCGWVPPQPPSIADWKSAAIRMFTDTRDYDGCDNIKDWVKEFPWLVAAVMREEGVENE